MNLTCRKAFTLLETLVAMGIFSVVLVGAASVFHQAFSSTDATRASAAVLEVQQGIRRDIYRLAHNFFIAASPGCGAQTPTFVSLMTGTLPSGVSLKYLDDTQSKLLLLTVPTGDAYESYKALLLRCAALPNPDRFNGLLGTSGLAFCLQLTSSAAIQSDTAYSLLTQQPVVAEFYYSNVDALIGKEIACPALRATLAGGEPSLGFLYYTFHWLARNAKGNPYRTYSGMVSLANGTGAPL